MSEQIPVKIDPVQPHENCWGSVNDLITLLGRKLSVILPAGIRAFLWSGPAVPPSDKTDWLWYKKTAKGRPEGLFAFHKGRFVPVWPVAVGAEPIMMFNGRVDAVQLPFVVCDGRDGTPDMTEQMLVSGTLAPPIATDFVSGVLGDGVLKDEVILQIGLMQLVGYED